MFQIIESNGKKLVVTEPKRKQCLQTNGKGEKVETAPMPNYKNTGLCLCGVLKPGQSIEEFSALYHLKKKGYTK